MDKKTEAFLLAKYNKDCYEQAKNWMIEGTKTINVIGKSKKVCIHNLEDECYECIKEIDKDLSGFIY
jgi:hypothetical protein